jgi:Transposase C of IS166 homeodomain
MSDEQPNLPSTGGPKPGDRKSDGTVYAGVSPDTGKAMYATPAEMKRARYGRSSEKVEGEIEQLEVLIGDLEEGGAESAGISHAAQPSAPAVRRERSLPVRRPLPEHLPRRPCRA